VVSAWENLFNLGSGEPVCNLKRYEVVNYCCVSGELELCFGWHSRADELRNRFKAAIPDFRRKYYQDQHPRETGDVTVAVNIRRGEVSAVQNNHMFTGNETILRTVRTVKSILDARGIKYRIDVYSNGDSGEFGEFILLGAGLSCQDDPIWQIRELIEADILILAKSSFSYYAALMSDGIKIFEPYLDPLDNWIPRDFDGSFDCNAFESQLLELMKGKTQTPGGRPADRPIPFRTRL